MRNLFFIALLAILISCSEEDLPQLAHHNTYGGVARHNSAEIYGDFLNSIYLTHYIENSDSSGVIQPPLHAGYPKFVLATAGGSIVYVNNKKAIWSQQLPPGVKIASQMCADSAGNIYAQGSDAKIYSTDEKGNPRFELLLKKGPEPEIYSDLLAARDGLLAGTNNGYAAFYDFDGNLLWQRQSDASINKVTSATTEDEIILPISKNRFGMSDTILIVNTKTFHEKALPLPEIRILSNVVYVRGNMYFAGSRGRGRERQNLLVSIDTTGKIAWQEEIPVFTQYVSVDSKQDIYFAGSESGVASKMSGVFKYDKHGKRQWNIYFTATINKPIIIGESALAFYAMTAEGSVVFNIKKDNGLLFSTMSLTDAPILNSFPVMTDQGVIIFGATNKLAIVEIIETIFHKIIPY